MIFVLPIIVVPLQRKKPVCTGIFRYVNVESRATVFIIILFLGILPFR